MSITSVKIIPARKLEAGDVRDAVSGYKSYESEVELDERRKIISPSAYIYIYVYVHTHIYTEAKDGERRSRHTRSEFHWEHTVTRHGHTTAKTFPPFATLSTTLLLLLDPLHSHAILEITFSQEGRASLTQTFPLTFAGCKQRPATR